MNLKIEVPEHIEQLLKSKAAEAGLGIEAFVLEAVTDRLEPETQPRTKVPTAEQFSQWLTSWAKQFPILTHAVDDSRESIYAGRGE